MGKVDLKLPEGTKEIVIREGVAPVVQLPAAIFISGIISSPADWYEGKKENGLVYDSSNVHVIHDIDERSLLIRTSEHFSSGSVTVKGLLITSSELNEFCINNTHKTFGPKELARFLKMNRSHFVDREKCMNIVSSLNQLKLKVEREIEDGNDFRGNKSVKFEQTVKSELSLSFNLSMPIFKGYDSKSFEVEILFDVTDGGIRLWLESVELKEIIDTWSKEIISNVLKRLQPLTVIKK